MVRRYSMLVGLMAVIVSISGCAGKCAKCSRCGKGCEKPTEKQVAHWSHYGERAKLTGKEPTCASTVLANPAAYDGKYLRLCGQVDSVCAARGCWLRLTGPEVGDTIFVKFTCPVEGRLIPMEADGRRAIVEGTVEVAEISEEEARHYKEDAGASAEEIAKIQGPQRIVRMKSPAAWVDLPPAQSGA